MYWREKDITKKRHQIFKLLNLWGVNLSSPSCFSLCSFCFWGEVSNSGILNDIGRNSLLGNRKKIAKFLIRTFACGRREIIVRGQSYFSRLPKYWTPIPLSARRVCTPRRTDSPGGEGDGGSIFWKTREIGLPSYNDLSTLAALPSTEAVP